MRVHITNTHHMIGVARLAQNMVTDIATKELGFREIGVFQYNDKNESKSSLIARFDGMLAGVELGDVIVFQSPSWNSVEWDTALLERTLIYDGLKRIIFIHDVIPLMWESNRYLLDKWVKYYNMADVIIAPSQSMVDLLRQHGLTVKKVVIQKMWDHIVGSDRGRKSRTMPQLLTLLAIQPIQRNMASVEPGLTLTLSSGSLHRQRTGESVVTLNSLVVCQILPC